MKNVGQIIDIAFNIMMLADRGLLEKMNHEGETFSLKEREDKRLFFIDILKTRNLYRNLSMQESEIINTKVGKLNEETFYLTQMQYEAIPILLWAVGITSYPKYNGKLCDIDFHSILGKHGTEQTKIDINNLPLDLNTIEKWKEIAMLWHWRSREGVSNPTIQNIDIIDSVIQIFGQEYESSFENIPVSKKYPRDFLVNNKKFNGLNTEIGRILLIQSKWRHHALAWITSDVSWEDVDTST